MSWIIKDAHGAIIGERKTKEEADKFAELCEGEQLAVVSVEKVIDCTGDFWCCDHCGAKSSMSPCDKCGKELGGCYGGDTLKEFEAQWPQLYPAVE